MNIRQLHKVVEVLWVKVVEDYLMQFLCTTVKESFSFPSEKMASKLKIRHDGLAVGQATLMDGNI